MKGKLIVLDGIDGTGKGTQTEKLFEALRKKNYQVEKADFPRYGNPSAAMVEAYLRGEFGSSEEVGPYRASTFYAIDRYAASKEMYQWLNEGTHIISNRYVSASLGHQTQKIQNEEEKKKFTDWLLHLEYEIFQIPKPDLTFLFTIDPKIAQELIDKKQARSYLNGHKRDIHEDDQNHLLRAQEAYIEIAKQHDDWIIIECIHNNELRSIEDIHQEVLSLISERFGI